MRSSGRSESGFTLLEVLVAMILLSVGALALASGVALSARRLTGSQDQFTASQRAAEAIENVTKARDTRVLTWAQIRNVVGAGSDNGVFLDGPQSVRDPGPDGLVNTADDGAVSAVITPGPDGLLGTGDDEQRPLFGFTREIEIRDVSPNLRQLRVIVRYRTPQGITQFIVSTFLSAYA
jgi:prepilin-type N-terminal cleavage/methylation domain-containing protein